jgi:hypothetical protein
MTSGKKLVINDEPLVIDSAVLANDIYTLTITKGNCLINTFNNVPKATYEKLLAFNDYNIMFAVVNDITNIKHDYILFKQRNTSMPLELFTKLYNLNPRHIIGIGDTNITSKFASEIIPHTIFRDTTHATSLVDKLKCELKYSYKCFGGGEYKDKHNNRASNVIIHEDPLSSWKCLMTILNNPLYGIIYKQYL